MLKSKSNDLSKNWAVEKRHGASYTGGPIAVSADGMTAACLCSEHVALLDLDSGVVSRIIPEDVPGVTSEQIINFALSPVAPVLVTCSRNNMMRVWNTTTGECLRSWKGQKLPVLCCDFDPSGTLVVTGSADRSVMVWDIDHGHATHSFKGHSGSITCAKFMPAAETVDRLVTASDDGEVRCWDLVTQSLVVAIKAHYSAVTDITFSCDGFGYTMLTSGRDKIISIWDTHDFQMEHGAVVAKATIPTLEAVETMVMLPGVQTTQDGAKTRKDMFFVTAGDAGVIRKWQLQIVGERYGCGTVAHLTVPALRCGNAAEKGAPEKLESFTAPANIFEHIILRPTLQKGPSTAGTKRKRTAGSPVVGELLAVTQDQIISFVSTEDLQLSKTIIGHNDDIVDVRYIPRDSKEDHQLLAVVTNSEHLQVLDMENFNSRLFFGHSDTILSLSVSPEGSLIATASKDKTARVWDVATGVCLFTLEGHTEGVSAVAWPSKAANFIHGSDSGVKGTAGWLVTGSKDRTMKLWDLSDALAALRSPRPEKWTADDAKKIAAKYPRSRSTAAVVAHEKDVNCMAVAPNDRLFATGSQDKTIKLWSPTDLSVLAVLRGHKRGVWAVAFSQADQVLASASGDRTVRLWSMNKDAGFPCLRTLEGHDASVLNVKFVHGGAQLMTTGADGLMKLWNVKDAECANTFDAHTQKVWALAAAPEGGVAQVVSGGGDSLINIWKDVTSLEAEDEVAATEEALLKQQSLYTAMATRDYTRAIELTLDLDQPGRCGDILAELINIGPTPATSMMSTEEVDAKYAREILSELADLGVEKEGAGVRSQGVSAAAKAMQALRIVPLPVNRGKLQGIPKLVEILEGLSDHHIGRLLTYIREWNTQSRHGLLAQSVLELVVKHIPEQRLLKAFGGLRSQETLSKMISGLGIITTKDVASSTSAGLAPIVNGVEAPEKETLKTSALAEFKTFINAVLPYSERHMDRLDRLMTSSYLVDFVLSSMDVLVPEDGVLQSLGIAADGTLVRTHKADRKQQLADDSESSDDDE